MSPSPLILYGAPATGKSTITATLESLDPAFQLFPMWKAGEGRTAGYRMISREHLSRLPDVLWRTERYGSIYALDRSTLLEYLERCSPIVHLGHPAGLPQILETSPAWRVVEVTCRREVAEARLVSRDPSSVVERLEVFDSTPPLDAADLRLDTSEISPREAATDLLSRLRNS